MDEVLNQFESTTIGHSDRSETNQSNFDGLYKNWGRLGNQEERRKELLEVQKGNRKNNLDSNRGIFQLVNAVERSEIFHRSTPRYRPGIYVAGFNKVHSYKNVLMLSEWIIERPCDFEENWLVLPCPKGVRMLVVANNGRTKFYTKYGQFNFESITALPGGSKYKFTRRQCCVLDGFYVKSSNTFYILDLLAWNNQPMTDGEAEFRHYWLQSELGNNEIIKTISSRNQVILTILPKVKCDKENFSKFMLKFPHFEDDVHLDGLLFYHKQAHYIGGETPLAGWLYPYMVPEVLCPGMEIHQAYLLEKPIDYKGQADFIQQFEEKQIKKRKPGLKNKKRGISTSSMDTADVDSTKENIKQDTQLDTEKMEVTELKKDEVKNEIKDENKNI